MDKPIPTAKGEPMEHPVDPMLEPPTLTPEDVRSFRRAMRIAELQMLYGAYWRTYWERETNPRVNPLLIVPYKR